VQEAFCGLYRRWDHLSSADKAVVLRFYLDLSDPEIAEAMGISVSGAIHPAPRHRRAWHRTEGDVMTLTEGQFRSILREEAADITAASVPPLSLPDGQLTGRSRSRAGVVGPRWRRWLIPPGAAAAVSAIAVVASTITAGGHTPSPNSAEPALWHGVPRDYFLLVYRSQSEMPSASPTLVMRDTSSGATLSVARPLQDCGFPQLSVAADDRTVVLACWHDSGLEQLFLARFDPG
jgi:hypothetical protein